MLLATLLLPVAVVLTAADVPGVPAVVRTFAVDAVTAAVDISAATSVSNVSCILLLLAS